MAPRFTANDISDDLRAAILAMRTPVQRAANKAMRLFANAVQSQGKRDILEGGLGSRMANALSVEAYPKPDDPSIDSAAHMLLKSGHLDYNEIFETGGTIKPASRKFLWIPLKQAPRGPSGKHVGPKDLNIPLFFEKRGGTKAPLLSAKVAIASSPTKGPSIASKGMQPMLFKGVSQLRAASARQTKAVEKGKLRKGFQTVNVPLFLGVRTAVLKARTHLYQIFALQQSNIQSFYDQARAQDNDE
jgi:hypothetical protein